jgi:Acetyltransferase (GNAT) domain
VTDSTHHLPTTKFEFVAPQSAELTSTESSHNWLTELREMRGAVLYNNGRRPHFRKGNGSFDDPDPIDLQAYHILAYSRGRLAGCARVALLTDIQSGPIASVIGAQRFDRILWDLATTRERACEASRWIVTPDCRGRLGPQIVAASWALARWLSVEIAFVLAGTRDKQDVALVRMGARAISGLPVFPATLFDDELRLLYFNVMHPSEPMQRQMNEAAAALNLEGAERVAVGRFNDAHRCTALARE